jgi:predicted kinase
MENKMTKKTLYILRGLPSSGKTTLAKTLEISLQDCIAYAADDFHYDDQGNYNWKPENVHLAHKWCQDSVMVCMDAGVANIVVHNTSTSEKELKPYTSMANAYGYKVVSLIIEKRHSNKNNHNVPEDVVNKMEERLQHSLKLR